MTEINEIRIVARPPDAETFRAFRAALGWGEMTLTQAERAVGGAHYDVVALRGEKVVGFGRVTGDGVVNFHLDDVIVSEAVRGQGIGQRIVAALLEWIETVADRHAMISLTASEGMEPFYEKFGFSVRPAPGYGYGMMRLIKDEQN
jgi:GNAT superfamily N-acetyltransferase